MMRRARVASRAACAVSVAVLCALGVPPSPQFAQAGADAEEIAPDARTPAERIRDLTRAGRTALGEWDLATAREVEEQLTALVTPKSDASLHRALHAYKAIVRYYEGRYGAALQEKARAEKYDGGDWGEYLTTLFARIEALNAFIADTTSYESAHFLVSAREGPDSVLVRPAADALEHAYRAFQSDFGFTPPGRIRVEIYDSLDMLSTGTGIPPEMISNSGTVAVCADRRIMITTPRALLRGYDWKTTLSHELVHYFVYSRVGHACPVWLHEGLAKYHETRWTGPAGALQPMDKHLLGRALREKTIIPLSRMHPTFARFEHTENAQAFAQVATLVGYMRDRGGPATVRTILDALPQHDSYEAALAEVFGVSVERLLAEWEQHVAAQQYPELTGVDSRDVGRRFKTAGAAAAGDMDDEWAGYEAALEQEGTEEERRVRLGNILRARGRYGAALEEYRLALRAAPYSSTLLIATARLEMAEGNYNHAIARLTRATQFFPNNSAGWAVLGEAYAGAGRRDKAIEALERARELNPFNPHVYRTLIALYNTDGADAEAGRLKQDLAFITGDEPVPTN